MTSEIMWSPKKSLMKSSALYEFSKNLGFDLDSYEALHAWSIKNKGSFWRAIWDFTDVIGDPGSINFISNPDALMTGAQFFPEAKLNLAENLLKGNDDFLVVVETDESGNRKEFSRGELKVMVAKAAEGLRGLGVNPGDRVAAILPNRIEALVSLLASVSIGAIWTSCSPDFGTKGIIDRIGQTTPKVLFTTSTYIYNSKEHDFSPRISEIVSSLKNLDAVIIVDDANINKSEIDYSYILFQNFGKKSKLKYTKLPFSHPSYILYTSGTTGAPKAIVHSIGGTILQHFKEHKLHNDLKSNDRIMWYTNIAWMMYHWVVSSLGCNATLVLYDGVPITKKNNNFDGSLLWKVADKEKLTHLGISPKYISTLEDINEKPINKYNINSLRWLLAAGSPVAPSQFDWIYKNIKKEIGFASISGGSEVLACFMLGSPIHPVRRGELTVKGLGMSVEIFNSKNKSVIGVPGDLVCTEPFPSMPITFWGKDGDVRYKKTYFEEREEIWTHGDLAELKPHGSGVIYGRTDNTLNPGGVRIGTAEIYNICELFKEIEDCLVFGNQINNDEEIILCIKISKNNKIDNTLSNIIRRKIRENASPRHVPQKIYEVTDIPYTMNGKRVEGAAKWMLAGKKVPNLSSISNPECLKQYANLNNKKAL
ncbi:MAG: acetoacetate--CoA ligase [Pelagibacterales bacterium]|nr:acetoacetate--CoA ligase [Pelagibacterales bacterium]